MTAFRTLLFALTALASLAACQTTPPALYLIDSAPPDLRVRPVVSSLEVRDVGLPRYASADEIRARGEDGALRMIPDTAWAEDPQRALTQSLARNLGVVTGVPVAAEPWPFAEPPAASLSVRVEDLIGGMDGQMRLTGQYTLARVEGDVDDRSGRFEILVPIAGEGAGAIAAAQGRAFSELAERIARGIAR